MKISIGSIAINMSKEPKIDHIIETMKDHEETYKRKAAVCRRLGLIGRAGVEEAHADAIHKLLLDVEKTNKK